MEIYGSISRFSSFVNSRIPVLSRQTLCAGWVFVIFRTYMQLISASGDKRSGVETGGVFRRDPSREANGKSGVSDCSRNAAMLMNLTGVGGGEPA
jgi:hypothetical protein